MDSRPTTRSLRTFAALVLVMGVFWMHGAAASTHGDQGLAPHPSIHLESSGGRHGEAKDGTHTTEQAALGCASAACSVGWAGSGASATHVGPPRQGGGPGDLGSLPEGSEAPEPPVPRSLSDL